MTGAAAFFLSGDFVVAFAVGFEAGFAAGLAAGFAVNFAAVPVTVGLAGFIGPCPILQSLVGPLTTMAFTLIACLLVGGSHQASRLAPLRASVASACRAAVHMSDDDSPPPRLSGNFRTDGIFRPGPGSDKSPLPFKAVRAPEGAVKPAARVTAKTAPSVVPKFSSDAERLAAEEAVMSRLEQKLLEACAPCFRDGIKKLPQQTTDDIVQMVETVEQAAQARRKDGYAPGAQAVRAALDSDWRLVFTNSAKALSGGISGYGSMPLCSTAGILQRLGEGKVPAQVVELLRLPFGATNAVILKGEWQVDEDEDGLLLACKYTTLDIAGSPSPSSLPAGGQVVATALSHVGAFVRLERAPSGAIFVWEKLLGSAIEDEAQAFFK